tara:strand:- start:5602 stop:6525 length:924 start_codon:yes stop_codon:yes gene_type:complete
MDTFISKNNKDRLFEGCTKLLSTKLQITVDKILLNDKLVEIIDLIKNTKNLNEPNIDLKTLNNICLTNIKNFYSNETGVNESIIQNKISNLELKRNDILQKYNNNVINSINNNKSFVITSLNSKSFNQYNLENINLDYNMISFRPNKLILPKYINNILPYISLNIYINNNILTYNYVCSFKNDIWDTWTTDDNYIFKLENNILNYSFTDYNDNLINFDLTKIPIKNVTIKDDYIYINIDKYISYFENKSYLIVENTKKKYKKNINTINNNNIIIHNDNDKIFLNNLLISNIILYENQFSLIMNFYSK